MTSFITRLACKLKAPSRSRKERWLWFVMLYGAALLAMGIAMTLMHGLVALLIAI